MKIELTISPTVPPFSVTLVTFKKGTIEIQAEGPRIEGWQGVLQRMGELLINEVTTENPEGMSPCPFSFFSRRT